MLLNFEKTFALQSTLTLAIFLAIALAAPSALAETSPVYDLLIRDADGMLDLLPAEGDEDGAEALEELGEPSGKLSAVVFGTPSLVHTANGQAMRLDADRAGKFYEQVRLDLGLLGTKHSRGASCSDRGPHEPLFLDELASELSGYSIDVEFLIDRLSFFGPNRNFSVFFDGTSSLTRLDFTPDGKVQLYDGSAEMIALGEYPMGEPLSLHAEFDFSIPSLTLILNDEEILFEESETLGRDLRAMRLSLGLGRAVPPPSVMVHDVYVEAIE